MTPRCKGKLDDESMRNLCALFVISAMGAWGEDSRYAPTKEVSTPELTNEKAAVAHEATVVFVHGMGRSRASLWVLQRRVKAAGYRTLNFSYSARKKSLDTITKEFQDYIETNVRTDTYHLVAHSLGNVIIRNGFNKDYSPGLERIVMLAPPNRPAELAKLLKQNLFFQWLNGDSGQKLSSDDFYAELPVPPISFGVVAGTRGQKLTFDEPNDGIVAVESTRLDGMKDWVSVHHSHTFLMNARDTAVHCISFLRHGEFNEEGIR